MLPDPELDITMDLARPRAGRVDRWVRCVVVLAVVATLAVLVAGPRAVWDRDSESVGLSRFWFHNTLAIGFIATLVLACVPSARGSRYVRVAVLLPVVHVVAMLGTWLAWQLLRARMPTAVDATPLYEKLPVRIVLPWIVFAIAGGARLVARRRRREWLHAAVMLALVNLLLLGLWLPVAANEWNGQGWEAWNALDRAVASPAKMIAFVVVPPFAAALVFTATALRWPQIWRRNSLVVFALLLVALVLAIACRRNVTEIGACVYVNFIHVIAAAALVTVLALVALGAAMWIGNARGRGMLRYGALEGTITSTHTIAMLELTSWLRGPRASCSAFTVATAYGEVPVPAGAHVAAATPLSTTLLRTGEAVPTLRTGDRVALAGYVHAKGEGPFRDTSAPIPGATGITVGRISDERYGFTHVALALWRPSIAYLLICVGVALPALAALLTEQF